MKNSRQLRFPFLGILAGMSLCLLTHCTSVKPYQKMHLNDEDMLLQQGPCTQFEMAFESYREGASGAYGSNIGGGCGCN